MANLPVTGAELYLLENWNPTSALDDGDQVVGIFSTYVKLPSAGRHAYHRQARARRDITATTATSSLPGADQAVLNRVRTPGERQAGGGMSWLRTYYGGGDSDAAFAAFMAARPDPPDPPVFQDAGRYGYGAEWERVLTRMPEMLDADGQAPEQYAAGVRGALEGCVRGEEEERRAVEDEGYDWEEDGPSWVQLYSAYHYEAKVGMIFVVDEETLSAVPPAEGKALVVWYDDMGRVVRSVRLSAQETWGVEGLEETMAGAVVEHDQWKRADPGEAYDWDGPLGPPYGDDDNAEDADESNV